MTPAGLEGGDSLGRQLGPLGVHDVVLEPLGLHGAECAQTDVERQVDPGDSLRSQVREDLIGEMKPGGRRGDRSGPSGVNGLVGEPIAG